MTTKKNQTEVYVPHGVSERLLDNGRPLEPGTTILLDDKDIKANQRLFDEGKLLFAQDKKKES